MGSKAIDSEIKSHPSLKIIKEGTITSVPQFYGASCHCGIKKSKKDDLGIIYTPLDSCCSGVFTTNKFLAAPVVVCKEQLKKSRNIKAIVINSGIANACTGSQGYRDARKTISLASRYLGIGEDNILVSSTGVIGKMLPMKKLEEGIKKCSKNLSRDGGHNVAKAILTTDKCEKEIAVMVACSESEACSESDLKTEKTTESDDKSNKSKSTDENKNKNNVGANKNNPTNNNIIIGGIAKGSGMIAPYMATMLAFLSTNVDISNDLLDKLLIEGVERSFNCITIDGCQSTNDMVLIQANRESGISIKNDNSNLFDRFKDGLFFVLEHLAKKIVVDGEGATKFVEIEVVNALTREEAKKVGMKIANSMLFKAAMFGEDLNWGRINAAVGSVDAHFDPDKIDIYIGDILIAKNGVEYNFDRKIARSLMKNREIIFKIDLKVGKETCRVWTTDLSYDYIKINSLYHT